MCTNGLKSYSLAIFSFQKMFFLRKNCAELFTINFCLSHLNSSTNNNFTQYFLQKWMNFFFWNCICIVTNLWFWWKNELVLTTLGQLTNRNQSYEWSSGYSSTNIYKWKIIRSRSKIYSHTEGFSLSHIVFHTSSFINMFSPHQRSFQSSWMKRDRTRA